MTSQQGRDRQLARLGLARGEDGVGHMSDDSAHGGVSVMVMSFHYSVYSKLQRRSMTTDCRCSWIGGLKPPVLAIFGGQRPPLQEKVERGLRTR
jgi:hypothetical protein